MMKPKSGLIWINGTIFILSLLLVVHFVLICLHAGPTNPISLSLKSATDSYVGRFFKQNWHLFAPEPMTQNLKLYVRVKYYGPEHGEERMSEWYNVTEPMLRTNEETLFSPYNRMLRIGSGYILQLNMGGRDEITYKLFEKNSENKEVQHEMNTALQEDSRRLEDILYRYASAFAKREFPEAEISEVQFMTSVIDAVPYSKRGDPSFEPEEQTVLYDWKGVVADVIQLP